MKKLKIFSLVFLLALSLSACSLGIQKQAGNNGEINQANEEDVSEEGQGDVPEQAEEPKASSTINEIDTNNWLTYRNEEYGFEIKYPDDYKIKEGDNIRIFHPSFDTFPPVDGGSIGGGSLYISKTNKNLDKYIEDLNSLDYPVSIVHDIVNVEFNGIESSKFIFTTAGGDSSVQYYIPHNGVNYIVSLSDIFLEKTEDILSTFKFIQ